ncbi:HAD-like domain-containing protein [Dioszegia hungarica]|uniref:HAD-like domain-containing protein n=1 Tax=Dioszegia hungarica TaxID=4972 RepID=A0AA38HE56_9TREE|nr:HAD-like domain-containing protein [Dioszegia hungarica]KAI9637331.1 HAD-like domain-containing protein [Dioszegia hungarica]
MAAFAFDIDGVLKHGKSHILPGANRVLNVLSGRTPEVLAQKVPFLLMTNGGGQTEDERLKALEGDFGVQFSKNQLVQSHTPLQDYVSEYRDKPVLVCGGEGDAARSVAHSYGLKQAYLLQDLVAWRGNVWDRYHLTAAEESFVRRDIDFSNIPFSAIFVIHDAGLDWALATQVITELLNSDGGRMGTQRQRKKGVPDGKEIPLILTNPDFIWPTDYPVPRFGMGAFRTGLDAVYKELTGCDLPYTQFGKPHTTTYKFAESMLRRHLADIGGNPADPLSGEPADPADNPASDIAGANAYGWVSLLVRTGVYAGGEPAHRPTQIVDNVEDGVMWALKREGLV